MDSADLAQDSNMCAAVLNTVVKLWVPSDAGNFLTSSGTVSFSRNLLHVLSLRAHSLETTQIHNTYTQLILSVLLCCCSHSPIVLRGSDRRLERTV